MLALRDLHAGQRRAVSGLHALRIHPVAASSAVRVWGKFTGDKSANLAAPEHFTNLVLFCQDDRPDFYMEYAYGRMGIIYDLQR